MTTKVTITGTGHPVPSVRRAGPGVLVEAEGLALQFDAGRQTLQRLIAAGVTTRDLDAVFVTHHHSDHLTGLPDLVMTRWVMDRRDRGTRLPIVCPEGPAVTFLERMLDPWEDDLEVRSLHAQRTSRPEYDIVAFDSSVAGGVVWQSGDVTVKAAEVRHDPVPNAVGFRIETPDGVVVISGDTLVCDEVAQLAAGADVLVYEAMLFELVE